MPPRQLQLEKGNCLITTQVQELIQVGGLPAVGSHWMINHQGRLLHASCTTFHAAALNTEWMSYITLACHKICTSGTNWFPSGSICSNFKLYLKGAQGIMATTGPGSPTSEKSHWPLKNVDLFLGALNNNTEVSLYFALVPKYHWKAQASKVNTSLGEIF